MKDLTNGDESESGDQRRVCGGCVGEKFLQAEIIRTGADSTCHYCGALGKTWLLEQLANRIETAFAEHYERTSDQPDAFESAMLSDRESDYSWERSGEEAVYAIASAAEIDETIAEDIREILGDRHYDFDEAAMGEEHEFAKDAHYSEKKTDDAEFQSEWNVFERDIKTAARFFSASAKTMLDRVFAGVRDHRTAEGRSVVVEAGPNTEIKFLIRARVFQSEQKLRTAIMHPDREIGPPPADYAFAGRMNPAGISVFYGAKDLATALAEVRPPVGCDVVTGCFNIIRPVQILDVDALRGVFVHGSIFDPGFRQRLEHAKFLSSLSNTVSRVVLPADEASGYLVTQVIADYLANVVKLDGILYRSVQIGAASANVVLFHHAAAVESLSIPEGAELDAMTGLSSEEGFETDYTVWERVPDPPITKANDDDFPAALALRPFSGDWLTLPREPALRLEVTTVQVHHVTSATYKTVTHPVTRHRMNKPKPGTKPEF